MEKLLRSLTGGQGLNSAKPSCFYLDWDNKVAEWRTINDLPPKESLKFTTSVNWKDYNKVDIRICSNYHEPSNIILQEKADIVYANESYLKSHLQKCVRRSNPYKALKTAKHFIDLNLDGFLRRLSIIAVEDALPLEGYSVLVWFVAAVSKGYYLSDSQICWCYGYLYSLCLCPYYERYLPGSAPDKIDFPRMRVSRLSTSERSLVYSLYFRKSYGGLKGDKQMLSSSTHIWYHRSLTKSLFNGSLARETIYITPPDETLHQEEWYLAGIDFHCCPYMAINLAEKFELDVDDIKRAIWRFSSSVTDKKNLINSGDAGTVVSVIPDECDHEHLLDIWKRISRSFFSSARYYLKTSSG